VERGFVSELKQSREELAVARELVELGYSRQAVSRAYYAAFYAARAALEAIGETPKSHSGMRTRFAKLAKSSPELGAEAGTALSRLDTRRGRADYGDDVSVTSTEANDAIDQAQAVVDAVERHLAAA
jgi:uncharacterized protein